MNSLTKKRFSLIGLLCAAVLGMIVMFAISWGINLTGGSAFQDSDQRFVAQSTSSLDEQDSGSQRTTNLNALSSNENSFYRSIALYRMLANAGQNKLLELWQQSKVVERNSYREEIQVAIIRKLSEIAPTVALDRALESSSLQRAPLLFTVFQEWSQSDLDGAITEANKLNRSNRRIAIGAILQYRDDLSDQERQEIANRLEATDELSKVLSEETVSKSIDDPSRAWDYVVNDDLNDASQVDLLTTILEEWYSRDGFEVLSNVLRSFSDPNDRDVLFDVIAPVIESSPRQALNYARGVTKEERKLLGDAIFLTWIQSDPVAALSAVSSFDENPTSRRTLQREMVYQWARSDPDGILEEIELLPNSLKLYAIETAIARTTYKSPQKAILQMKEMEGFLGNNSQILARIVVEWSEYDPRAATDWIVSNIEGTHPERHSLLAQALRRLSLVDPQHALEVALNQPVDRDGRGLELEVVRALSLSGNSNDAIKMIDSVRGSAKVMALVAIGNGLVQEEAPHDALDLASRVPKAYQWYFYDNVFRTWAGEAPTQLLETLDRLESDENKSRAGVKLIIANRVNSALTDEQIDFVMSFLNEEDSTRVARLLAN